MTLNTEQTLVDSEVDNIPPPLPQRPPSKALRILLGVSLVLIAANLRPVFSSLSVLLPEIILTTGISSVAAGVLTTLPVVCMGIFAPLAAPLSQRLGAERVLLIVIGLIALGTLLRGFGSVELLFIGAIVAGAAIAMGNVLLPGVVKRDFSNHTALMTGLYTMALCAGAAFAAGLTIPLKDVLGDSWSLALGFWAIPAALVFALWLPQALRARHQVAHSGYQVVGLWKDKLAWQVTLYMASQSSLAYIVFGWLAPMLRDRGISALTAGGMVSFSIMMQAVACLIIPSIAVRQKSQSVINIVLMGTAGFALLGFLYFPLWTFWPLAMLLGIAQGGTIASAMTEIVLRSPDAHTAARLSGMAQSVGYTLAAIGPLVVGMILNVTGSFAACGLFFVIIVLIGGISGWGAGRPQLVGTKVAEKS